MSAATEAQFKGMLFAGEGSAFLYRQPTETYSALHYFSKAQ